MRLFCECFGTLPRSRPNGGPDGTSSGIAPHHEQQPDSQNVLYDLILHSRWNDAMERMKTEEGWEDLKREDWRGRLPLHRACGLGAPLKLVKALVEGCPAAVRMTGNYGLPLHWACSIHDISPQVVRLLLDKYPEGAKATDFDGGLPLHTAADHEAPLEVLGMLVDAYPEGASTRDNMRELPVHCLARYASPERKDDLEKLELLIRPLLKNQEACRIAAPETRMLPIHIAARFGLSMEIFRALLFTYSDAAEEWCGHDDERTYALDLLEKLRNDGSTASHKHKKGNVEPSEHGHEECEGVQVGAEVGDGSPFAASLPTATCSDGRRKQSQLDRATTECSPNLPSTLPSSRMTDLDSASTNIGDGQPPGEAAEQIPRQRQLHLRENQTARLHYANEKPRKILIDSAFEFNKKSDLLFAYNPNILRYRKDKARLQRFVDLIVREAQERNLSETAQRVWVWMCTFSNADDPSDTYVDQINAILGGLGDRKLVEWLASVETPGVRLIREIAAPMCAKAINAHFLFAGRFELSREPPLHKSATCIVVEAKDFGDPSVITEHAREGSALHEYERTVVKFMSDQQQFDREVGARNLTSSHRSSMHSEQSFLVHVITYFDSLRAPDEHDRVFKKDIQEQKHVFGHDLVSYPYAIVMPRADRNFDSIYRQEVPSMLKIRAYVEELTKKLELLHIDGKIHADVKLLNVVRLDGLLTLIDMDASRKKKAHKAGTKFSSGILPPEMIYKLKNEEEENQHSGYWKDVKEDFMTVRRIVKESNGGVPAALSDYLEKERNVQPIQYGQRLQLYGSQSKTVKALLDNAAESSNDFYHIWNRIRKNEALWRKLMPFEDGQKQKYVVKAFRHDAKSDDRLPYDLVVADVSLDMWSLGVLLFKLCTKTDLFHVNDVNDDLLDGEAYAEVYNWDLSSETCKMKLSRVENELARDLLKQLLESDPDSRPRCMTDVLKHDFFRPDYSQKKVALEAEVYKLQKKLGEIPSLKTQENPLPAEKEKILRDSLAHYMAELENWKKPISVLALDRKWDTLFDRINDAPDAIPTDLLLLVCRYGPTIEVIEAIIQANGDLVTIRNAKGDLPLHVACWYGATLPVVRSLVKLRPESMSERNAFQKRPLDNAQTNRWTQANDDQKDVVRYLRRQCHPDYFDDMTGLPKKCAFDVWANLPPPGVKDAKAFLLYIDISGFKAVNDKGSHETGDYAIKQYARDITKSCENCATFAKSSVHLLMDEFRTGGDEFVVVAKIAKRNTSVNAVWESTIKPLVEVLASLTFEDSEDPRRYCTFLRIGCCAGNIARVNDMLKKAEQLQVEIKERIGLQRGAFVSLRELQGKGILNFSECVELI